MDGDKAITGSFARNQYTLDVTVVGGGSVTKQPDQAQYPNGAIVTLTAAASAGWTFASWSGDASGSATRINVLMDGNKAVTATFVDGTVPTGSVQGVVVDVDGDGIPDVQVTLTGEAAAGTTALVFTDTTGAGGDYRLAVVPAGSYSLTFTAEGYLPHAPVAVQLAPGEAKTIDTVVLLRETDVSGGPVYLPAMHNSP